MHILCLYTMLIKWLYDYNNDYYYDYFIAFDGKMMTEEEEDICCTKQQYDFNLNYIYK